MILTKARFVMSASHTILRLTLVTVAALLVASPAAAQMFGRRSLGGSLSPRLGPGMSNVGSLSGSERFLRANRAQNDFVGTSAQDLRQFVGARQVAGTRQAVGARQAGSRSQRQTTTPRRSRRTQGQVSPTQVRPAARKSKMYEPRLQVAFPFKAPSNEELGTVLAARLEQSPALQGVGSIEVVVQEQTAILRGEVVSAQDAALAELLVRLEPGIDAVRNELKLAPGSQSEDSLPPANRQPADRP